MIYIIQCDNSVGVKSMSNYDINEKSKSRVREYGEVYTSSHIVNKMCDMVPEHAWKDPTYLYLEPTCGNGNFLVAILQKRIDNGISVNKSLNTLWAMDILEDNIHDCHVRLCEIIIKKMRCAKKGGPSSEWWQKHMVHYIAIIENNIFKVNDSLQFISDGDFDNKKFVFDDPTGNENVLSLEEQQEVEKKILTRYKELCINRNNSNDIISMFI